MNVTLLKEAFSRADWPGSPAIMKVDLTQIAFYLYRTPQGVLFDIQKVLMNNPEIREIPNNNHFIFERVTIRHGQYLCYSYFLLFQFV